MNSWPTYTDLSTWFINAGINMPASGFANNLLSASIEEWNHLTGYTFLAATGSVVSYDYPANGVIVLNEYWESIDSIAIDNDILSADEYYLNNNILTIKYYLFPKLRKVTITGTIGFSTIPQVVWNAVLEYTAYQVINLKQIQPNKLAQLDMRIEYRDPIDVYKKLVRLARRYKQC